MMCKLNLPLKILQPPPRWTDPEEVTRSQHKKRRTSTKDIPQLDGLSDPLPEDDEELHSEDDIPEDIPQTSNLIVCQFEKVRDQILHAKVFLNYLQVTRSKNKRKCVLLDGIMNLNGKTYMFQKATGEMDF